MGNNTANPITVKVILSDQQSGEKLQERTIVVDKYAIYELISQKNSPMDIYKLLHLSLELNYILLLLEVDIFTESSVSLSQIRLICKNGQPELYLHNSHEILFLSLSLVIATQDGRLLLVYPFVK